MPTLLRHATTQPVFWNNMKTAAIILFASAVMASTAAAQFTGPSAVGASVSVAQSKDMPVGRDITVVGHIVAHLREDYYTFRDASGEIRVEIESSVWRGRQIGADAKVRLSAETGQGLVGRYLWVKSLAVVE